MPRQSRTLYLYSTSACHLCHDARTLIDPFLEPHEITLVEVDIAGDDELMEAYGVRIPVLRFTDARQELGWPFNEAQFLAFAQQQVSR